MVKNMANFCENCKNHSKDTASNHGPEDHYKAVWLNTSPASPASLLTSPAGDVCKYYIGPSVACLSVLSSAAAVAVATLRHADRQWRVYNWPTATRSRQVSGHVVLLRCRRSISVSLRWPLISFTRYIEVTRRCYIINGRWCHNGAGAAGDVFSHTLIKSIKLNTWPLP